MPIPDWPEVRESLASAIRAALPLQVREAGGGPIAGLGLHIDAYYGSAGLYLLPELATEAMSPAELSNIGNWQISTDWDETTDHAEAFNDHWHRWDDWFRGQKIDAAGQPLDVPDEELISIARGLLRVACEAMRQVELEGLLDSFPRSPGFRIIIVEHTEPDEMGVERYELYSRTGTVRTADDGV